MRNLEKHSLVYLKVKLNLYFQLGIKKAFDGNEADLTGFLADKKPLVISDVVQKAFINVTETGTEAAAATFGELFSLISYETSEWSNESDYFFIINVFCVYCFVISCLKEILIHTFEFSSKSVDSSFSSLSSTI